MWIPQENKEGYEAGSAMTYAKDLKGRLLLYYGTADNNVHPSNIDAADQGAAAGRQELRRAGRPRPRPQRRQSGRMMEFFIENLIVRPAAATSTTD